MRESRRAQSEALGVALLTGVVVIAVAVAGGFIIDSLVGQEADGPLVDADVSVTASTITLTHAGGDTVDRDALTVVVERDGSRRSYQVDAANTSGDGDGRFEPSESWTRNHGLSEGRADVLVVHEEGGTSSVLTHAYPVVPTPAANA